ncbi:MAG: winged helix-turn-helix transcriptional regulator, partial [Ruminococcus sp.]|nr:winged helix-turn-helix transcriptional regulator [Ruminococcus sp.]
MHLFILGDSMAHYKTNQRRELAAFLMENHDNPMSASQISEKVNMSVSAVYRNLEVLEK